jgi:predicted SAM-dependent methyltransferase
MAQKKKTPVRVIGGKTKPLSAAKARALIAPEALLLQLDLGAGETPREGFQGVDLYAEKPDWRIDLTGGDPWPWGDGCVDALHSSHFIEHIEKGNKHQTYTGQGNLFYFFFEEAYRVLKAGGVFTLQWPALQSVRAFQDPTHCDFIPLQRVLYLDKNWREMNKLSHYTVKTACDFVMESGVPTTSIFKSKLSKPVQEQKFEEAWNFSEDFIVQLRKR